MRTTLILALSALSLLAQAPEAKKPAPKPAVTKTEAKPATAAARRSDSAWLDSGVPLESVLPRTWSVAPG